MPEEEIGSQEVLTLAGKMRQTAVAASGVALSWLRGWPTTLVLLIVGAYTLLPMLWTFFTSFKGVRELYRYETFLPRNPSLSNYQYMFYYLKDIPIYFKNSIVVSIGTVVLRVICASLMGYAFARMEFRGRDLIFYSMIVAMFIPRAGTLMAEYELMATLHLRNSLLGLILYFSSGLGVPLFIMRQNFLALPREIEESAMIDGASRWRIFRSIALPFAAGGMMVVAILTFVQCWGDYLFTYTMIDVRRLYTVGVGIAMFYGGGSMIYEDPEISGAGIQAAGYLVAAAPAMLLYIGMQRYFIRGLTEGILKL